MKPIHISIFDLDKTVIDSDYRTPYKENGDLCLSSYRAKQTHENIKQDQLLTLASVMQTLIKSGAPVVIVSRETIPECRSLKDETNSYIHF